MMILVCIGIIVVRCIFASVAEVTNTTTQLCWTALRCVRQSRTVLNLSQGSAQSGRILGVIGPSGCGKTTFLRALAMRISPTTGVIQWMGGNSAQALRRSEISLMHQDDSFFSMLTVKETVILTAQLHQCMHNKPMNYKFLHDLLSRVGLQNIANSTVGRVRGTKETDLPSADNPLSSGISGGERKRLALACQLVGNPVVLLADEPTSGLDAFQAHQVVQLLKEQSRTTGAVVICAIHQPRSSIWSTLDDVMLLTPDGRTAYHGPRAAAVSYFSRIGYPCPVATNPAEYLIDLVSLNTTSIEALCASQQRIDQLVDAFELGHKSANDSLHCRAPLNVTNRVMAPSRLKNRGVVDFLRNTSVRVCLLIRRSLRQVFRDNSTNIARVVVSVLLACVISAVYGRPGAVLSESSVSSRINIVAQAVINVAMLAMIKTLQLFENERGVVSRERGVCLYSAAEYLMAKAAVELPIDAVVAACLAAVLHARTGPSCAPVRFVGMLALLGAVSSAMGLAISALAPSGDIALTVGPAIMVVYLILGSIGPAGVASASLPAMLLPLRHCSPMKWACEGLCAEEFTSTSAQADPHGLHGAIAAVVVSVLSTVQGFVGQVKKHCWRLSSRPREQGATAPRSPGQALLCKLGIGSASYRASCRVLWTMLGAHLLAIFVGLRFSGDSD